MNKYVRRSLIGLLCGLVSSVLLVVALRYSVLGIFLGVLVAWHTRLPLRQHRVRTWTTS
jgi:hypothetical protein